MPPDVRKRFGLQLRGKADLGWARRVGIARNFIINWREGRRLPHI